MDEEKKDDVQPETVEQTEQPAEEVSPEEKSMGPVLGSIIVVIILVVAAFYVWGTGETQQKADVFDTIVIEDAVPPAIDDTLPLDEASMDTATEALNTQSKSDEIAAIEADLEATDLSGLDAELDQIDLELQ